MARLTELRNEIGDVVEAVIPDLLRARTAGGITPPAFLVVPSPPFGDYQRVMGDELSGRYRFAVTFLLGSVADQAAQDLLDEWVSPDGPVVPALYDADIDGAEVMSVGGQDYGQFKFGDAAYPGASLLVEIEA